MSLEKKVDETIRFLREQLQSYSNPVCYESWGKDSMVLLHLLLSQNIRIPLIYHRDPFFPRKNHFADQITNLWNLEVWDYPPARVSLCTGKEMIALVSEYATGQNAMTSVLKNSIEYKDGDNSDEFLCGVNFLMRPCGIFSFPWDSAFIAHKSVDEDPIFGPVPLHSSVVFRDEGPDYVFPLREWTHADVWDYTEQFKVPFQADRYDLANRCEWPDKTFNSDWYPVCVRCIDRRIEGQMVFCPKLKKEIKNQANKAPEFGIKPDYFSYSKERMYGHSG